MKGLSSPRIYLLFLILIVLFRLTISPLVLVSSTPLTTSLSLEYDYKWNTRFDFNESSEEKLLMKDYVVENDALVQIYCHLFANSTNNITLLVEPDDWNVTHIPVKIGQEINITVTNGEVMAAFSDVFAYFKLYLQRANATDEVHGQLSVIVDTGWHIAPWSLVPGVLALIFVWMVRRRRTKILISEKCYHESWIR